MLASGTRESLGSFLDATGLPPAFRANLLLPMTAAIWSCGAGRCASRSRRHDPARLLLEPRDVADRRSARVAHGGGREPRVRGATDGRLPRSHPSSRRRSSRSAGIPTGVSVRDGIGPHRGLRPRRVRDARGHDAADPGDDATAHERATLGAFGFQPTRRSCTATPRSCRRRRAAWSSWNYLGRRGASGTVQRSLTYWMNRLQNLQHPSSRVRHLESRSRAARPFDPLRLRPSAVRPRGRRRPGDDARAPGVRSARGSRARGRGYGFHEDGLRSGLEVADGAGRARAVGRAAEPRPRRRWCAHDAQRDLRRHGRRTGGSSRSSHRFRYGVYYLWLDLDELATLDRTVRGFGYNRAAPFAFHDRDHGPHDGSALRPWFDGYLRGARHRPGRWPGAHPDDPADLRLRVQSHLRVVRLRAGRRPARGAVRGHEHLRTAPRLPGWRGGRADVRHEFHKELFVSPFIDMDATYEFRLRGPGRARVALRARDTPHRARAGRLAGGGGAARWTPGASGGFSRCTR